MPTLLELQRAMRLSILQREPAAVVEALADGVTPDRFDIYRNTIFSGLTKALRLSYPAVQRLVGNDFFDGAAAIFIAAHPPREAYLDRYGGAFSDFLRDFAPAASLVYLADVARLEWAINGAIHAPDAEPLDLAELAAVAPGDQGRVRFTAHPSLFLVRADYPVDVIWRAVLTGDDDALTSIDIHSGAVWLRVERCAAGVEPVRMDEPQWRFLSELSAGQPIQAALDSNPGLDCDAALAGHLAAGRFVAFAVAAPETVATVHHFAA